MSQPTTATGDDAIASRAIANPLPAATGGRPDQRAARWPDWGTRHGGVWLLLAIGMGIGLATRMILLLKSAGDVSWNSSLLAAFAWGGLFDLAVVLWCCLPLTLILAVLPARAFERRAVRSLMRLALFAGGYLMLFVALAEWFFWDEFGVRFNFIAVDYLVYTTEVIGNIRESYPLTPLFTAIGIIAVVISFAFHRLGWSDQWLAHRAAAASARWRAAASWTAATLALGLALDQRVVPHFDNAYNAELAKNGVWSFFAAFRANQLDFERFYPTLPEELAFARMHATLAADGGGTPAAGQRDLLRQVSHPGPELHLNVVQITVESLSAEFLTRYGETRGLTPNLDALVPKALVFDRMYATGNRTDRGMEALTLGVPPTPGRSLVKRPENAGLFTLGSVFRAKGYATTFMYGGYGYFDNMNAFFGGNGYRVVDRTQVPAADVTFANIWGACDEDLFRWTLREADRDFAAGRPFFQFVMTTSNHRPYTFPVGRIDLPPKTSGRAGGVKYTDYAIGEFLRAASTRPWFKETVFVIVADHCASSAGRTELPVQNYHIPLLIYAPGGQVQPGPVATLGSQVDFGPTLLGLLGWSYPSRFYGHDLTALPAEAGGRALIGNYQKVALYRDGKLAVLQPVRQGATYSYDERTHELRPQPRDAGLLEEAIAYYQTASWLFKHHVQRDSIAIAAAP
ncbi:MAG: LTA synthase family protein [Opitutaceae bacterium]|nr:LTA synthase family protein [Opitutaceae bacterium]